MSDNFDEEIEMEFDEEQQEALDAIAKREARNIVAVDYIKRDWTIGSSIKENLIYYFTESYSIYDEGINRFIGYIYEEFCCQLLKFIETIEPYIDKNTNKIITDIPHEAIYADIFRFFPFKTYYNVNLDYLVYKYSYEANVKGDTLDSTKPLEAAKKIFKYWYDKTNLSTADIKLDYLDIIGDLLKEDNIFIDLEDSKTYYLFENHDCYLGYDWQEYQEEFKTKACADYTKLQGHYAESMVYAILSGFYVGDSVYWVAKDNGYGYGYDLLVHHKKTNTCSLYEVKSKLYDYANSGDKPQDFYKDLLKQSFLSYKVRISKNEINTYLKQLNNPKLDYHIIFVPFAKNDKTDICEIVISDELQPQITFSDGDYHYSYIGSRSYSDDNSEGTEMEFVNLDKKRYR